MTVASLPRWLRLRVHAEDLGDFVRSQSPQAELTAELCSNNLYEFGLKKGLDHLDEVRNKFLGIISRFAGFQAQWLNVHTDFPLLQKIALPITVGSVRYPGIKIHDTR